MAKFFPAHSHLYLDSHVSGLSRIGMEVFLALGEEDMPVQLDLHLNAEPGVETS